MKEKTKIIIAMLVQVLALVNLGLAAAGKSPIPLSSETVEVSCGAIIALGVSGWNFWKNRNITTAAQKGQELIDIIKQGKATYDEVDKAITELKSKEGE